MTTILTTPTTPATAPTTVPTPGLDASELAHFDARGYVRPFDILTPPEIDAIRPTFETILSDRLRHPVYGRTTHRDWHLHYRNLMTMVYRPAVIRRLQSLLGEDLLVWRTSIFHKGPGDGELEWHQSSLFAGEEYGLFKPALLPPPEYALYGDLFNVSVWIALDDVTAANGAVRIATGTQRKQYPVRKVPLLDSVFGRMFRDTLERHGDTARLEQLAQRWACSTIFDAEAEQVEVDTVELRAGQGFIFTDRVVHGSLANTTTDQRRLGINFRVTVPKVRVYPHLRDGDPLDGNDHDVTDHACVMLAGSDRYGHNVYLN